MSNENIKLGIMPPLTGLVGIYGSEIVHAAQVACQEINENGGVLGRPLELIIEDDGSLPDSAVIAAKKLIDEHHCSAIIGNLLSNSRIAVAYSVAEPRKIPLLNFSFYEGSIISPYFFHFAALPNQQIDKMIPYMRNKFGPRMFFAGNNYEWPRGSIHAGKLALENVGGEVVGEEYTPIGVEPDVIEKLLDHVEAANPDVFVPYFAGSDQVLLLTRFTERGLKDKIAVVMGHYDEMMASQLSPEVRDGFYSSNTYFMTIDSEENKNYKSRLANLPDVDGVWPEGNGILTNFGEGTYVCVKAFAEAANKAGSIDGEVLIDELDAIRIKAPQGAVHMNPEHHHAKVNTYLSRCDANGVFNIIENFGAIEPEMPARYRHQQIANQATLEDDIRLQARILEQMTDAVILVSSADGTIVYTNTGAEKLFAYDKDEMIGLPITSLNDSADNNPHDTSAEIIKILNQTGEWQGEVRNIKKDGTSIWCSSNISTFTHPAYGEVWLGVQREITQIKYTESALRESEGQLKEAQRIAKVGGWELDIVGNHLKWTDETYHIFEIEKEDFNDAYDSFLNKVHPDDVERVEKAFGDSVNNHTPYEIEHRIVTRDGRTKFVLETCEIKYNANGTAIYATGIVQDITERVEQENALKESEEKFRSTFEQAAVGVAQVSTNGEWLKVNNKLCEIIGYTEKELLDSTFQDITHPDDLESDLEHVKKMLKGDINTYSMEKRYIKKKGEIIWIFLTVSLVNNTDGTPKYFISIVEDINDRKNTEVELDEYRNRLEELVDERTKDLKNTQDELVRKERLATLGQLTATVSHELRNPLGAMRPSMYIIEKSSDKNDEFMQKAIERVDRNIDRCDNIIDELLDFTRITELNLMPTRIDKWLESVIEEQVIPEGLHVDKYFGLKELELNVDVDRLRRAFINVFDNANHSMMDVNKNIIKGKKPHLTIKTREKNNRVEIIISDTGCGITNEVLAKIFEPLFSTKGFGVGLGMSTVKQIMEQHHGGIEIESKEGKGTTIILWLPLNK